MGTLDVLALVVAGSVLSVAFVIMVVEIMGGKG